MRNLSLFFFVLFSFLINAQKSSINLSLKDTNEEMKLNKYLEFKNLCNKVKFIEENISEFVSLDSPYKNLDKILEDVSEKSNYEIQIIVAYGKHFTSFEQRKEKLFEDIAKIKYKFKCSEK